MHSPGACDALLRDFCLTLGMDEGAIRENGSIDVDDVRFYFLHHGEADPGGVTIAMDLGELPVCDRESHLEDRLRANACRPLDQGIFAVLPHNRHAALLRRISLADGLATGHSLAALLIDWAAEARLCAAT